MQIKPNHTQSFGYSSLVTRTFYVKTIVWENGFLTENLLYLRVSMLNAPDCVSVETTNKQYFQSD